MSGTDGRIEKTRSAMKYNQYSSLCNICNGKGWHKKPEKCVRTSFNGCKICGSHENISKPKICKGINILIDYSQISQQFVPFYENGKRIKVKFSYGEIKSGTVGMTSGWKPVFILMLRSNSIGSSYILADKEIIL